MNVSVLVCTYGDPEWRSLGLKALNTALTQQPEPHEAFALHYPDATLAEVRNAAAARATGEWLCFLDADDELAPGYLTAMAKAERRQLLHDPATLARTEDALLVPAVEYDPETPPCIPAWGRSLAIINCAVIGTLVPRDLFHRVGCFREWPMYEDWDLWLRCHYQGGARLVDVCDAVYRDHSGASASGRNSNTAEAAATYHAIRRANRIQGDMP